MVLTEEQEKEVEELLNYSLAKGKLLSGYGRDPDVYKEYGNRYSKAVSSYKATTYKPSAREIRGAELQAEVSAVSKVPKGTIFQTPEQKKISDIKNATGLDPVFVDGRLTGFEDSKRQMSYSLESLSKYSPESISILERKGYIRTEQVKQETNNALQQQGGFSRINPTTKRGEYVLASGLVVNATPETRQAIIQGRTDEEVMQISQRGSQSISRKPISSFGQGVLLTTTESGSLLPMISLPFVGGMWEQFKEFTSPLFTPALSSEEIRKLPAEQQGREGAKSIFFGGIEGIYRKLSTSELKSPPAILESVLPKQFGKGISKVSLGEVYPLRVTAELIPRTTAEVLALRYLPKIPTVARIPIAGTVSVFSGITALNPDLPKEKRIAAGIVSIGAGTGAILESIPFVRGGLAKLSPDYATVKVQPEGFKAIELKETRIGLIYEKSPLKSGKTSDIQLPTISPLKRGGFGYSQSDKTLFMGEKQLLTTSQRSLFKKGVSIPLEKEFFVTPQEPFLGIPETRISRLGLTEVFKFNTKSKLGLGIPQTPQIGLTIGKVGRVETSKVFKIGGTSELEAIKTFGTIQDVSKIGVTTLKGQLVQIYTYKIGKGTGGVGTISTTQLSKVLTPRVSSESVLFSSLGFKTQQITPKSTTTSITSRSISIVSTKPTIKITPSITTYKPSNTKNTLKINLPSLTTGITRKVARSSYTTKPRTKPIYYSQPKRKSINVRSPFKGISGVSRKRVRTSPNSFSVYVRRQGKFKPIGSGLSLEKAFSLGTGKVKRTLAATFLVKQQRGTYRGKTPLGFYSRPSKYGTLFIEKRSQRIKKSGLSMELPELKYYKRMKGRKLF